MRKLVSHLQAIPPLLLVWIVLNEEISWPQILLGVLFAGIALIVTNSLLIKNSHAAVCQIRLSILIRYTLRLIVQVFLASLATVPRILKGQGDTAIDAHVPALESDLSLAMLAMAVTLTPGTVAFFTPGKALHILHFVDPNSREGHAPDTWKPVAIESILASKRP